MRKEGDNVVVINKTKNYISCMASQRDQAVTVPWIMALQKPDMRELYSLTPVIDVGAAASALYDFETCSKLRIMRVDSAIEALCSLGLKSEFDKG